MGELLKRYFQLQQEKQDKKLKSPRTSQEEIYHRWPYEVWLRVAEPNPTSAYTLVGRAQDEIEAVKRARRLQKSPGRKVLVFYHPTTSSVRVMVWNDLKFGTPNVGCGSATEVSEGS
jgi:hypothetical protein